jgi:hypothetical protein
MNLSPSASLLPPPPPPHNRLDLYVSPQSAASVAPRADASEDTCNLEDEGIPVQEHEDQRGEEEDPQ